MNKYSLTVYQFILLYLYVLIDREQAQEKKINGCHIFK